MEMQDNPMNPFRKDTGTTQTNDTGSNLFVKKCETLPIKPDSTSGGIKEWEFMTKPEAPDSDMVYHPKHYRVGGIETLDFVKAKLNTMTYLEPFQAYCIGNAMKYLSRAGHKGEFVEDIEKAIFYLNQALGKDQRNV